MYFVIISLLFILIFIYEDNILSINKYKVSNNKIPNSFNNYKIVHLSDIHSTFKMYTLRCILDVIYHERPDIVVITGDLYDERIRTRKGVNYLIRNIPKDIKIYYILGNHENRCKHLKESLRELEKEGVILLNNESIKLMKGKSYINLIGIKDVEFIERKRKKYPMFMDNQLKEIKIEKNKFSLMLSHRPELFDIYVKYDIDLTLAGHAHGGQFRIPCIGGIYAPEQGLFPKYTSGIYEKDNKKMIVSRGIGNSGFPIRINNKPQLVIVELSKE